MKRNDTYRKNPKVIPYHPVRVYAYPNAKNRRYYFDKAVDFALATITSAGVLTALLFLLML